MVQKILASLLTVLIICLVWAPSLNQGFCEVVAEDKSNFEASYAFTVQDGYYLADHTLYVSFPPSVMEYYTKKNLMVRNPMDYAKLVTPSAVQSIADNIRSVTGEVPFSDE